MTSEQRGDRRNNCPAMNYHKCNQVNVAPGSRGTYLTRTVIPPYNSFEKAVALFHDFFSTAMFNLALTKGPFTDMGVGPHHHISVHENYFRVP